MLTADLIDQFGDILQSCETQFRSFGGRSIFHGPVRTIQTFEDNALVREVLSQAGNGAVLVIDGKGSLRTALLGDQLAHLAQANGWSGVILHLCIRGTATSQSVDVFDGLQCELPNEHQTKDARRFIRGIPSIYSLRLLGTPAEQLGPLVPGLQVRISRRGRSNGSRAGARSLAKASS